MEHEDQLSSHGLAFSSAEIRQTIVSGTRPTQEEGNTFPDLQKAEAIHSCPWTQGSFSLTWSLREYLPILLAAQDL